MKNLKNKLFDNWIATIIILPVNVLIIIPAVLLYLTNFTFINLFYIHYVEEPQLKKRFGKSYEEYLKKVPCWIPKIRNF